MTPIRILIADDHSIVRIGLTSLLSTEPDLKVVGSARNGSEAITEALRLSPDVIIMDLMMPKTNGTESTAAIKKKLPDAKVLLLTTFATSDGIANALAAGASGAVLKNAPDSEIISAIRTIATGDNYVSDEIKRLFDSDPPVRSLTERQHDILESTMRGLSNPEIARQFGISETTVKNHLTVIFEKLGAANRSEAIAIALRKHLLKI